MICNAVADRYPLVIFAGDVGTGKTVTAEGACDRLAREAHQEAMLFKLSTRVRGSGKVGQMSTFSTRRLKSLLSKPEKPGTHSLLSTKGTPLRPRGTRCKATTRTKWRLTPSSRKSTTFAATPAAFWYFSAPTEKGCWTLPIVRRAALTEKFDRPTDQEREELFRMDLDGLSIKDQTIHELVRLTGPRDGRPGLTFSDLRSKLLPDALCRAFPSRALTADDLIAAAKEVRPSPVVGNG